jgi:hypothetical protein
MKTINTIAEIDADGWLSVHMRIQEKMEAGPVEAIIILQPCTGRPQDAVAGDQRSANQKELMECIQALRKLGPVPGMEDPVAWQRTIREERELFHGK